MSDSLEESKTDIPKRESSMINKPACLNEPGKNGNSTENIHYEDNKCIFTDPETKSQLEWNEEKQKWEPKSGTLLGNPEDYELIDGTYTYSDKSTGVKYKWNKDKNCWDPLDKPIPVTNTVTPVSKENESKLSKDEEEEEEFDEDDTIKEKEIKRQDMSKGHYGYENDTHIFTDSTDGTVYFWDKEKNAWFPKVDDDFLAQYQLNYGFVKPEEDKKEEPKSPIKEDKPKVQEVDPTFKRKAQEPTWFEVDPENNTKIYVSNLPLNITEQEFVDLMQKCGLVMKDPETGKMKVKLYTETGSNALKGDALCTYIKVESVELALNILDGCEFKGNQIKVERAKFTMKGDAYDPKLKPRKKRKKDKEKLKKIQEKLLDWRPDKLRGERSKSDRVVIIKNLFDPVIFDKDVPLILEYQQDIREECAKCGDIRKVTIYDRHPEGVAQVIFKEAEAADACIQLLNNRWFGQRQITAETWDGKTKYKIVETEAEIKARLQKWNSFLEAENKIDTEKKSVAIERDSDQDTRSSAGSEDESDDDSKK